MSRKRRTTRARPQREPRLGVHRPAAMHTAAVALLLLAAGAWAYSTSVRGVFVLDDIRAIVRNPTIRTLSPLSTPLSPPVGTTVSGRPLANLTLAVNYALAPADARDAFVPSGRGAPPGTTERFLRNVRGYHLLNLLIHLSAGLALFGVVRQTLWSARFSGRYDAAATWLAGAAALVWLVHPLQTSAVTYIVQRVESLMGLFYLLTLYCAIRAARSARASGWEAGAIVSCAAGMATKEVMVTAPVVVWLWMHVFADRGWWRRTWPLFAGLAATWGVFGALVLHEYRGPSIAFDAAIAWQYLLTQAAVLVHYLRLAVVPSPLVFLYTWPLATSLWAVLPQAAMVAALVALTLVGLRRRHPIAFAGAWFFVVLAPTSSVVPIVTEVAAEHRMYLPLAALVTLLVVAAYEGGRRALGPTVSDPHVRHRVGLAAGVVLALVVASSLGLATRARNRDYWSDVQLWSDTVAKQPRNERARVAHAEALANAGRVAEAEAQLRAAVDINPTDGVARVRLGTVLGAQGKTDEAVTHLEQAVALRPGDPDAHRGLAMAYASRGQPALAAAQFERVLQTQPDDPLVLSRLAALLADTRDPMLADPARAVALAERAAALTSRRDPVVLNILSAALAGAGRLAEAEATAREAQSLAR